MARKKKETKAAVETVAEVVKTTYYKCLSPEGRSMWHGGGFQWTLPVQNGDGTYQPGEWHELKPPMRKPENAFHATDTLAMWWKHGGVGYVIEFDGETENDFDSLFTDHKVWGLKARIVRPMTAEELTEQKIFFEGAHRVTEGKAFADGNSTVEADGNSTVRAYGNSTVRADGNSTVRADGNSTVEADGNSTVEADGNSTVEAYGNSTVEAYGNSTVRADGNSTVRAYGNSTVRADGNSTVRADGNSTVRAYGNSTVTGVGESTTNIYKHWWTQDPKVVLSAGSNAVLIDRRTGKPIVTTAPPEVPVK